MKALRHALAAGILIAAFGCSRSDSADKQTYDGASTRSYLMLVGQVRSQINSDNRERIPAMIGGVDTVMLDNQASKLGVLKQSLSKFPTDNVDPDAVQFAQNIGGIIDLYQAACKDSAELYREVARQDETIPGQKPRMPAIRAAMRGPPGRHPGRARGPRRHRRACGQFGEPRVHVERRHAPEAQGRP
jgi:hypothetical protein